MPKINIKIHCRLYATADLNSAKIKIDEFVGKIEK